MKVSLFLLITASFSPLRSRILRGPFCIAQQRPLRKWPRNQTSKSIIDQTYTFIYIHTDIYVYIYIYTYIIYLHIYMYIYIYLYYTLLCTVIYLSIYPSIYLSIYLCTYRLFKTIIYQPYCSHIHWSSTATQIDPWQVDGSRQHGKFFGGPGDSEMHPQLEPETLL